MSANQNAPTFKANKGVRFYNPGDRFSEPINYSIPGQGDIHAIARFVMDAEAESFFQVPTELRLLSDGTRIPVDFPTTVLTRFKDRGIVMVDDEWEPGEDEEENDRLPFATTDDMAREKGKRLWRKYLEGIVRMHIEQCNRARTMGGMPLEAAGFTRRAFKLLNMVDPATQEFERLQRTQSAPQGPAQVQSAEATQLRAELDETNAMLKKVLDTLKAKEDRELEEKIEKRTANPAADGLDEQVRKNESDGTPKTGRRR